MKTEPAVFSIDDLERAVIEPWDGVRNYQARNYLRAMRVGDLAFIYHSGCTIPAIVGIAEIVRAAYPDATALDPSSPYYDSRETPENQRWSRVDVRFISRFARPVTLAEMKACEGLAAMPLCKRGSRLSVMPIAAAEWKFVLHLAARQVPMSG